MELTPACSGILLINKCPGMTSHDVVNKVRRLYKTKQVGHTGTLDPMATGVLPVLIGRAAKAAEYLVAEDKCYSAVLKLGVATDTEDITGVILRASVAIPNAEAVRTVCARFVGEIEQIPPMYSALKVNGKKLCDLARQHIEIERQARKITISSLAVEPINEQEGLYRLDVHCSKGCYIRTLCADIGAALKCGGCMASLRRTKSGQYPLSLCHTVEEIEGLTEEERIALLLPTESLFDTLPIVSLSDFYGKLASSGCPIYLEKIGICLPLGTKVRLYRNSIFFALGEVGEYEEGIAVKAVKQFILF